MSLVVCRELGVVWAILTGICCVSVQPGWNIARCTAYLTWMHNKSGVAVRRNQTYSLVQSTLWDLWLTKWHWVGVFSEYVGFYCDTTLHQCDVLIYSSPTLCNFKSLHRLSHFASIVTYSLSSCNDVELSLLIFPGHFSAKISNKPNEAFYGLIGFSGQILR